MQAKRNNKLNHSIKPFAMNKLSKLALFISLISFCHLSGLQAQITSCPHVDVEVFPLNPQTGIHNYFGVRVTLDQTMTSDVTVTGFIYDCCEGIDYNENNPFSLTVTAGNTVAETSAMFYQTGPASDGAITVSSISY